MASDVLASLFTAVTYYKNKNIDVRRGLLVALTAFFGSIIGSYCGYLFSQQEPDGLGYISMLSTVFLGLKFLIKPIVGGETAESAKERQRTGKTALAMVLGCLIGWVCGFTGSGGGILMLTVFTLVLGYNLKVDVGTSTLIMTLVAMTGAVSHFSMGAKVEVVPFIVVVISCLIAAVVSARFANKCNTRILNRMIGSILLILGVATTLMKLIS